MPTDPTPSALSTQHSAPSTQSPPILRADNLSFSYTATRPVLSDISLSLPKSHLLTLLGPNGSGKSTLIKLLLHHLRPSAGTVTWFDRDVRRWKPRDFARRVAYLPQSPTAGPADTVLDVVRLGRAPHLSALGLESESDLRVVRETADLLSLSDLLHEPLSHLSGGQRQRVFLARALAQRPDALLLDEPTTYLDLRHQLDLLKLLRSLATDTGLAVLMSGHDLNLAAAFSDQILLLDAGRPAGYGPPADVLTPELLSAVYQTPMTRLGPYVLPDLPAAAAIKRMPPPTAPPSHDP
jgi:iron complex transport system ATP-binding protein